MTNDEYGQLVEFLGRKFEEVDRRFDRTATRDELQAQQTETRRHFDVVGEGLRSQMQLLAEGHQALVEGHQVLVEGQERILERVESLERELGAMIRISYASSMTESETASEDWRPFRNGWPASRRDKRDPASFMICPRGCARSVFRVSDVSPCRSVF